MDNNYDYIQLLKGYDRAGQFPLEKNSKFTSYTLASEYARGGATRKTSAYIGQSISVVDEDNVRVYLVNKDWKLEMITGSSIADKSSFTTIDKETLDGQILLNVEEGSYIKSFTVVIQEPFENESEFIIGTVSRNGLEKTIYFSDEDILTNEVGTYTIFVNEATKQKLPVQIWFPNGRGEKGQALFKIN